MKLSELASHLGGRVEGDGDVEIRAAAPIVDAGNGDVTFLANPKYKPLVAETSASAIIVRDGEEIGDTKANVLRVGEPYGAFVRTLALFDDRPQPSAGIHDRAVVAESAEIGPGAYVGPCAVVGDNVRIGRDCRIFPNATIYEGVTIGDRFTAHAGSVVREGLILGDDVTLQPGAVLGADGFGFLPAGDAAPVAIPQIGRVKVGDNVDVGANTTVDRAAVGESVLGEGVKLDNLVMVAHGCRIGDGTMIAAQTGIAGSTSIGKRVIIGGQVGINGHIDVHDEAKAAGGSRIVGDVDQGATVAGFPAVEIGTWRRYTVLLKRLPELFRRLRALEAGKQGKDK